MKMKLDGGDLIVADVDSSQYAIIKSFNLMRWNRQRQWLEGPATMELLDKFSRMVKLPESIEAERLKMHRLQNAVDGERMKETPTDLYDYPIKGKLFEHQKRAANMCLMSFGLISPEEWEVRQNARK